MNTKKTAAGLAALVGIGAATLGVASLKPAAAQTGVSLPPGLGRQHSNRVNGRRGERHPEIRAALRNLNQAKNNLQRATHDFGGHREKALDHVQQAINECNQALQDDKR